LGIPDFVATCNRVSAKQRHQHNKYIMAMVDMWDLWYATQVASLQFCAECCWELIPYTSKVHIIIHTWALYGQPFRFATGFMTI